MLREKVRRKEEGGSGDGRSGRAQQRAAPALVRSSGMTKLPVGVERTERF
jgi:hypothetical protein